MKLHYSYSFKKKYHNLLLGINVNLHNKWAGKAELNRSVDSESFPTLDKLE